MRVCVERYGFESVRITGGEPTCGPTCPGCRDARPLGIDIAMTTNGVKLPEMAHDLADAGLRRINVSLDSLRPDVFRRAHPPRRPRPGARRDRRRARRRPRPGEGQLRRDPRRERRRGRRPRRVRARAGRRRALHRVHAPRRRRRVDHATRSSPPARSSSASTRCSRSTRAGRRLGRHRARRAVPRTRDGIGDVGVIAERHRAVLRQLRPHPDHRRGQAPHLPVRARRVRPAGDPPRRCRRRRQSTTGSPPRSTGRVGTKWAGHRIGQVDFVRPARSMSQIGG